MPLIYIFVVLLIFQFGLLVNVFCREGGGRRRDAVQPQWGIHQVQQNKIGVISVVAMQVLSIVDALSRDAETLIYDRLSAAMEIVASL